MQLEIKKTQTASFPKRTRRREIRKKGCVDLELKPQRSKR
ncbi:unnamed protein product [Chondrus crispus]|uniref:Uncharacterized protein n=1 Tax=Chondrus crispus TaxID=2769 RepID=R7Q4V2_CHOCR|nr:unnamed protein product [Chondrus crispus]CDF33034.1 unnamed protein product [Chondrus crispus]|eukprot:XP_005712837.1 unnamed protein product [Chondrus crispus]